MTKEINLIFGIISIILGIWTLTITGEYKFAFSIAFMLMGIVFIRHYIEDSNEEETLPNISILGEKYIPSGEAQIRVKINLALNNLKVFAQIKSINIGPIITQIVLEMNEKDVNKVIKNKNNFTDNLGFVVIELTKGKENLIIKFLSPNKTVNNLVNCIDNKINGKLELFVGSEDNGKKHIIDLKKHNSITITGNNNDSILNLMNSMIISLLMKHTSNDLELVLIDNSGLNFNDYNIPHLMYPTNEDCLNKIVDEIGARLERLGKNNCKNISEYNGKEKIKNIVIFINDLDYVIYRNDKEYLDNLKTIMEFGKKVGIYLITSVNYTEKNVKNKLLDVCDTIIDFGNMEDVNLCNVYYPKKSERITISYVSDKNIQDVVRFYSRFLNK